MSDKSFMEAMNNLFTYGTTDPVIPAKPEIMTWAAFQKKTSEDLDGIVMEHAKTEGLVYVGGKCRFTATPDENDKAHYIVNVDVELYYKDQFKADKNFQIYPLHNEKKYAEFDLQDTETRTQLEKLKKEQLEFNVQAPQTK